MSVELRRIRICGAGDVPAGEGRVLRVGDRPLAVFNTGELFRVLDATCTHMGGNLADGLLSQDTVACPLHERRFALATGRAVGHNCGSVAAYPVERDGEDVYLTVPVRTAPDGPRIPLGTVTDAELVSGAPTDPA